jgi:hypothetical protein
MPKPVVNEFEMIMIDDHHALWVPMVTKTLPAARKFI